MNYNLKMGRSHLYILANMRAGIQYQGATRAETRGEVLSICLSLGGAPHGSVAAMLSQILLD